MRMKIVKECSEKKVGQKGGQKVGQRKTNKSRKSLRLRDL